VCPPSVVWTCRHGLTGNCGNCPRTKLRCQLKSERLEGQEGGRGEGTQAYWYTMSRPSGWAGKGMIGRSQPEPVRTSPPPAGRRTGAPATRGLHSSTFRLNVSPFVGYVAWLHGVSVTNTAQVERGNPCPPHRKVQSTDCTHGVAPQVEIVSNV